MTKLDTELRARDIGDAAFGAQCVPPIARGQIWNYRHGYKVPRSDTAAVILAALAKLGITMTLEELITPMPGFGDRRRKTA
jgi:hypothetical protein